jgi:hypothetical protein
LVIGHRGNGDIFILVGFDLELAILLGKLLDVFFPLRNVFRR